MLWLGLLDISDPNVLAGIVSSSPFFSFFFFADEKKLDGRRLAAFWKVERLRGPFQQVSGLAGPFHFRFPQGLALTGTVLVAGWHCCPVQRSRPGVEN